jgi:hypothetical protein
MLTLLLSSSHYSRKQAACHAPSTTNLPNLTPLAAVLNLRMLLPWSICLLCRQGLSREIAPGSFVVGATADPRDPVYMIKNKDGSLEVEDMQGNRAKVLKADLDAGKSVVYVIDRVLLNGKMRSAWPIDRH